MFVVSPRLKRLCVKTNHIAPAFPEGILRICRGPQINKILHVRATSVAKSQIFTQALKSWANFTKWNSQIVSTVSVKLGGQRQYSRGKFKDSAITGWRCHCGRRLQLEKHCLIFLPKERISDCD